MFFFLILRFVFFFKNNGICFEFFLIIIIYLVIFFLTIFFFLKKNIFCFKTYNLHMGFIFVTKNVAGKSKQNGWFFILFIIENSFFVFNVNIKEM